MSKILKQAESFAYRLAANSFCDFQQWCIDHHRPIDENSLHEYSQVSSLPLEDYVNISRFLEGEVAD